MNTDVTIERAIAAASSIEGWCEIGEMRWLAERALEHRTIVEVGSWQGRSAKALAIATDGIVYSVDDFRGAGGAAADGWYGPKGFPLGINATPHDQLEARFRSNLADEIAAGKLELITTPSPDGLDEVPATPDMIYLDGDHETDAVRADLRAALAILAPDGLLCGHDGLDERVTAALDAESIAWEIAADNVWTRR